MLNNGNGWEANGKGWETNGNGWEANGKGWETNGNEWKIILLLIFNSHSPLFNLHDGHGTNIGNC